MILAGQPYRLFSVALADMATATGVAIEEVHPVPAEPLPNQGQPTENLHVEERLHNDTEIVWPTGPKLWVNMTCILVTQFLLGLVRIQSPSVSLQTMLTKLLRT